jgi:Protein of unknown function (DUF3102)
MSAELVEIAFDYAQLDPAARETARDAAGRIRAHGRIASESIVAIGAELVKVKAAIGHGHYLPWLEAEFGWGERTAQRFVAVHECFGKSDTVADLEQIDVSALYLLAAPSTPEPVREEALEKAAAGERITQAGVQQMIAQPEPASDDEADEKTEADETEFILERVKAAFELVARYKGWKPHEIGRLFDQDRRTDALATKARRAGELLRDLSQYLGRPYQPDPEED